MSADRFIRWREERPSIGQLHAVARDFLGVRWSARIDGVWIVCETSDSVTDALASEGALSVVQRGISGQTPERCFSVFHDTAPGGHTSVITRLADEFTDALADRYAAIVARRWDAEVTWPG